MSATPRFSPLFRSGVPGHNHSRGDEFFPRSPPQRRLSPEIPAELQEIPMAYVVRYGRMRFLGEYAGPKDQNHFRGQHVVLRTDRGTELGEVLCPATERTASYSSNPFRERSCGRRLMKTWNMKRS